MTTNDTKDVPALSAPAFTLGYFRDDGAFRVLATLSNIDEEMKGEDFNDIAHNLAHALAEAARNHIVLVQRQDAPDYVDLDEQ